MHYRSFISRLIGALLLAAIALSACAPQPVLPPTPQATPVPTPKPEVLVQKLVEAVNAKNIEGALALFAEDAVVNNGDPAPYTGTAEIRGWLEKLAGANFQIQAETPQVDGDTVVEQEIVSMDPWNAIGITSLKGVRKIKTRDGRIQSLDFSFDEASLNELQIASLKATQPTYADLSYSQEGRPDQILDLYLPQTGSPPFPVILIIHGWGDKKETHNGLAGFFNRAGIAAVAIDYGETHSRLVPDALCALAWTRANAGKYGLDPDRITLFGYSVGGRLAATLGTLDDRSAVLQDCGNSLPDHGGILGVAAYEGVMGAPEQCFSTNLCLDIAASETGMSYSELLPIFKTLSTTDPAKWKDKSVVGPQAKAFASQYPLYWLDGSEPPFLVIQGSGSQGDNWSLPRIESEAFVKRLQEAGVNVQLLQLPNASHHSIFLDSPYFLDIAGAVLKFAKELDTK
jgi:acetyl esterase/lipase